MRKRLLLLLLFLLAFILPLFSPIKPLQANSDRQKSFEQSTLPISKNYSNFDIRSAIYLNDVNIKGQDLSSLVKGNRENLQIRWRNNQRLPHLIFSHTQGLTPPSLDLPEKIIKKFLADNPIIFDLNLEQDSLKLVNTYQTKHNGMQNIVFQQQYQGLPIFGAQLRAVLKSDGQLMWLNNELIDSFNLANNTMDLSLSAQEAINFASQDVRLNPSVMFSKNSEPKLVLFPMAKEHEARTLKIPCSKQALLEESSDCGQRSISSGLYELRPAWQISISDSQTAKSYLILVDAKKGTILFRANLTWYFDQKAASYKVFTSNTPQPNLPFVSTNPPFVERQLITTSGDAIASPNGWLDSSGLTKGNNTDAQTDRQANDSGNGFRPQATNLIFDFPLILNTPGQEPELFPSASVTSLFYWTNFTHDYLYKLGFDEVAGNFQLDNFGRGGMGGDPVVAEAQDGSGFNNASFGASEDGFAGRMQVFLWKTANPKIDSAYDAEVIIHEYVHGLTTRLVGGPQNVVSLLGTQSAGMGEGWSDWYAMSILSKPQDDPRASYPYGSYVTRNFTKGIRRFAYSTEMSVNPLTYADIDPTQTRFTKDTTEIHNVGEVWCQALWEVRANFIEAYGFERGKEMIEQLVTDALKITPVNPSMIDGRDAILLADQINNNSLNQCMIWKGFAKRGLGFSAASLGTTSQVKQAFDNAPYCQKTAVINLDKQAYFDGELVEISLGDADLISQNSVDVLVTSQKTGDRETLTLKKNNSIPGQFLGSIKISLTSSSPSDGVLGSSIGDTFQIAYQDASNDQGQSVQTTATAKVLRLRSLINDSLENGTANFTPDSKWQITTLFSHSPTRSWTDSPNGNYQNRTSAMLKVKKVDLTGLLGSRLVFWQKYQIERGFDFGFVEVKLPQQPWQAIAAFTGEQKDFQQTTVDLSKFDGKKMRVRFRLVSDGGTTADGWYIDDIEILSGSAN
ncbi:MAG: M36 family metallopeptidase [Acidobacteria bacterium]|nr:M36 family metallopeptidase [Acidobacteriota bacterium]